MKLGERIKKRRHDLKLSQDEIARSLGYTSRSSISKIESGKNDIPHSKVADFAEALQTTPQYLMGISDRHDLKSVEDGYNQEREQCLLLINEITKVLLELPEEKLTQIKDFVDFVKTK